MSAPDSLVSVTDVASTTTLGSAFGGGDAVTRGAVWSVGSVAGGVEIAVNGSLIRAPASERTSTVYDALSADRTAEKEPAGAAWSVGPAGQPPMPGPPASPSSAMVRPCRFASASSSCQAMARAPPPSAAILATSALSKWYVAVKVVPVTSRSDDPDTVKV